MPEVGLAKEITGRVAVVAAPEGDQIFAPLDSAFGPPRRNT